MFLFVRTIAQNRVHDERALHGAEAAEAGITALKLLHEESVLDVVHGGAAVTLGFGAEVGAEEAELGQFRDELRGEDGVAVTTADQRGDALIDEAARGLADEDFLCGKERIEKDIVDTRERHGFQSSGLGRVVRLETNDNKSLINNPLKFINCLQIKIISADKRAMSIASLTKRLHGWKTEVKKTLEAPDAERAASHSPAWYAGLAVSPASFSRQLGEMQLSLLRESSHRANPADTAPELSTRDLIVRDQLARGGHVRSALHR